MDGDIAATNLLGCAPGGMSAVIDPMVRHTVHTLPQGMPNSEYDANHVTPLPPCAARTTACHCQTDPPSTCDIECQTDILTLSPLLCMELLPTLTHKQAVRELRYFKALSEDVKASIKFKGGAITRNLINDVLHQALVPELGADFDKITENIATCHELISNFARVAERLETKSRKLATTIDEVTELVHKMREKRHQVPLSDTRPSGTTVGDHRCVADEVKLFKHCPNLEFDITGISSICDLSTLRDRSVPFIKLYNTPAPIQSATIDNFDAETDFTHDLGNRVVAYYGEHDYVYSGIVHRARDISLNAPLADLYKHVNAMFPDVTINSALVQKYSDGAAFIPLHSDNEPSIVKDSAIISVSLGTSRTMHFVDKSGNTVAHTQLNHGDITVMSRHSQDSFRHHIPATDSLDVGCRISITFRHIAKPPRQSMCMIQRLQMASSTTTSSQQQPRTSTSHTVQSTTARHPQPPPAPSNTRVRVPPIHSPDSRSRNTHPLGKPHIPRPAAHGPKVLFVTDSILNRAVDKQKASRSTTFRLAEFLALETRELCQYHSVVISTGVNDLSRYDETSGTLFRKFAHDMTRILRGCGNTTFIFRGLLDTDIGWLNKDLRSFNTMVFDFALGHSNLWYYDTTIVPPAQQSILRKQGGLEGDWTTNANGVHIKPHYARALAADLLLHAWCLAPRALGQRHRTPPSAWPLRPFFQRRRPTPTT